MCCSRSMRNPTQQASPQQPRDLTDAELLAMIDSGWPEAMTAPRPKSDKRKKKRSRSRG